MSRKIPPQKVSFARLIVKKKGPRSTMAGRILGMPFKCCWLGRRRIYSVDLISVMRPISETVRRLQGIKNRLNSEKFVLTVGLESDHRGFWPSVGFRCLNSGLVATSAARPCLLLLLPPFAHHQGDHRRLFRHYL
jgi:hypothetical protein